ncbi:alpha beta-hydrolase [Neolentinus lepideus HHB14362 ss-1]|uniref:Carboxylic ester hydrolase n=1 Tax=Neolentinus lepideus HHB14362 ss-1 TaxID=1314782 RepID=A0A165TZV4_9AGAM|nr:alpha beta-hydrolase [Neolentinus lepideus HHB14362 ss-1]
MKFKDSLYGIALLASVLLSVCAVSFAAYPDTRAVVISNNDLNPSNPSRASALYLSGPFTCAEAYRACGQLQETLLPLPNTTTGLTVANLSSVFLSEKHGVAIAAGQKVWIMGEDGCGAFTPGSAAARESMNASDLDLGQRFPALCTNSAPPTRSNTTEQDTTRQVDLATRTAGTLTGFRDKFTFKFLGIKFAEAPAGENRFQPPIPLTVDNDTRRSALKYGTMCPQAPDPDNGYQLYTDEDCLQLNVFSPIVDLRQKKTGDSPKLPVMFFIHGGGLNTGDSGSFPFNMTTSGFVGNSVSNLYDGTNLVSYGGVVLDNIEAFGGDPDRVLLFGESAGAVIIRFMLAANTKYTKGLYNAAILESDFPQLNVFAPAAVNLNMSLKLAQSNGCASDSTTVFSNAIADCVRNLPAGDGVMASYNLSLSWNIVIDGDLIVTDIASSIVNGLSSQVPTIWTSNQCEFCYFIPASIANASADLFPELLSLLLFNSTQIEAVLNATDLYPYEAAPPEGGMSGSVYTLAQLGTDYGVHCPMAYLSSLENNSTNPGHSYKVEFAAGLGSPLTPNPVACVDQVCHGDELYWVFATAEIDNLYQPLTEVQLRITRDVIDRWTSLARTGNVNYEGAVIEWPPYASDNEIVINAETAIQAPRVAQCEFLRTQVGFIFGEN